MATNSKAKGKKLAILNILKKTIFYKHKIIIYSKCELTNCYNYLEVVAARKEATGMIRWTISTSILYRKSGLSQNSKSYTWTTWCNVYSSRPVAHHLTFQKCTHFIILSTIIHV